MPSKKKNRFHKNKGKGKGKRPSGKNKRKNKRNKQNKTPKPINKAISIKCNDGNVGKHIHDINICGNCSKQNVLSRCSGCKMVYYCNKQCQSMHWNKHKKICKLQQKQKTLTDGNIIESGWCLVDNKQLFIVLTSGNTLYFYNQSDFKNHRYVKKINLDNCTNIKSKDKKSNDNTFEFTELMKLMGMSDRNSSFKYGLLLETNTNNDILLFFSHNNVRDEWFAHFDFIKNEESNYLNKIQNNDNEYKNNDNNKNKNLNYDQSMKILLNVLNEYDEWIKNENKDQTPLRLTLNYRNILNNFHIIITDNKHNNNHKYKCNNNDQQCHYTERHIGRDKNNENNNNDILHELLDKMHCFIYHKNDEKLVRNNINDKFVINIQQNDDDNKHNEITFAFGELLPYYSSPKFAERPELSPPIIIPYFSSLKEELISNPYYKIDKNKYNIYYLKALLFKKSEYGKKMKAKQVSKYNRSGIKIGDAITINHIISLMIYCNETELQKIYKKHTRKHHNEASQSLYERHKYIANWCRYLAESCRMYGNELRTNEFVYCGLDKKLLFDSVGFDNYCPLSTSSSIAVANTFASHQGMILKLTGYNYQHQLSANQRYIDMIPFSNFDEKEKFFCGFAKLKIVDIIIDGESNKPKVSSLSLLEKILNGSLFYFKWNKELFSDDAQNTLCNLLNDYINNKNKNDYFHKLMNKLINSFIDRTSFQKLFLNIPQIKKIEQFIIKIFFTTKWNINLQQQIHKMCKHKVYKEN